MEDWVTRVGGLDQSTSDRVVLDGGHDGWMPFLVESANVPTPLFQKHLRN